MRHRLLLSLVLGIAWVLSAAPALAGKGAVKVISIDTAKGELRLDGATLSSLSLEAIKGVLGKPGQVKTTQEKVRYEKRTLSGKGDQTVNQEMKNHFYLYDQLGLVFFTRNARPQDQSEDPVSLVVSLAKASEIQHGELPAHMPAHPFGGKVTIYGVELKRAAPVIPDKVTEQTERVPLFNTLFSPASAGAGVESVYSISQNPGVQIFFDSVKGRRPAFLEIKLGR